MNEYLLNGDKYICTGVFTINALLKISGMFFTAAQQNLNEPCNNKLTILEKC